MKRTSTWLRATGTVLAALLLASTAAAPLARAEDAATAKKVKASLASHVKLLQQTAATLRKVAKEPDPSGLTEEQQKAAKEYAAWILSAAQRCDALAKEMSDTLARRDPAATDDEMMSFNLQYLQLQSQMQHENRSCTAVSNIMKTKHDTVKNSISNLR